MSEKTKAVVPEKELPQNKSSCCGSTPSQPEHAHDLTATPAQASGCCGSNKKPQADQAHQQDHSHGHAHNHEHKHSHAHDQNQKHGSQSDSCQDSHSAADTTHTNAAAQSSCCGGSSHQHAAAVPVTLKASQQEGEYLRTSMRIMQMDCPTEEGLIQNKLGKMPSVIELDFNLMQRVLTVLHQPAALPEIVKAVKELGFDPELANEQGKFEQAPVEKQQSVWLLALAGCFAFAAEVGDWISLPTWFTILVSVIAIALSGIGTYKKGLIAVKNFNLNINALMSIAVTGAVLIGHFPEAAMVMVLFSLAELIEAKSLARARNAISQLMELAPEQVTVLQADGQWLTVNADQVELGNIVRVKPGERIGLDGVISKGQSSINQAPITGESLPVDKAEGDPIFAGTINESGSFEYRVTAGADNTTLARIIHAVESAQGEKAPTQRFVDRFAKVYTPLVFIFAILIAVIPPLLMGGVWFDWIYKALVILVIACPCALVISTPVTVVSGLAAAARQGILIKGGVYLEQGRLLKYLAFDKTGTITHGQPKQTDFQVLAGDAAQVTRLLLSLASRSDHPVSQAMVQADSTKQAYFEVEAFTALAGRGTRGVIDGVTYWLGNHRLIHDLDYCSETLMLSGDNAHTVNVIAAQVGMNDAKGNLLPEDKLNLVASYADTSSIGMVGDGINDAPALARADIGFAMGTMGSDVAIETADVALMDDDLRKIPNFIRLSKKTHQILVQNISLALITKLVFLILTMMNLGTMWMAVFADVGVSLLVVANGLRLLRKV